MAAAAQNNTFITFTGPSDLSAVESLVHQFRDFVREWGADHFGRTAEVLRTLLFCVISGRSHGSPLPKLCCWIERTPEGCFKVTVENEGAARSLARINATDPYDPRLGRERQALLHELCRNMLINDRGSRLAVLIAADGSSQNPMTDEEC